MTYNGPIRDRLHRHPPSGTFVEVLGVDVAVRRSNGGHVGSIQHHRDDGVGQDVEVLLSHVVLEHHTEKVIKDNIQPDRDCSQMKGKIYTSDQFDCSRSHLRGSFHMLVDHRLHIHPPSGIWTEMPRYSL